MRIHEIYMNKANRDLRHRTSRPVHTRGTQEG